MKTPVKYTGINIQYPISRLILDGSKTIETRTYPIPERFVDQDMILVETPGKQGKFQSRMVAVIRFSKSFEYKSKAAFYRDANRHQVTPHSMWAWKPGTAKFGWPISMVKALSNPIPMRKRPGIVYTKNLVIPT